MRTMDIDQRPIHFSIFVFENSELTDLLNQFLQLFFLIPFGNTQQGQDPGPISETLMPLIPTSALVTLWMTARMNLV